MEGPPYRAGLGVTSHARLHYQLMTNSTSWWWCWSWLYNDDIILLNWNDPDNDGDDDDDDDNEDDYNEDDDKMMKMKMTMKKMILLKVLRIIIANSSPRAPGCCPVIDTEGSFKLSTSELQVFYVYCTWRHGL